MSKDPQQIPTVADVIGPGIDAARAARPSIEAHLAFGRWGHVTAGWRAQFEVLRKRLAEEVMASRRVTAKGQALTEICSSEYETPREGARYALGEVTVERLAVHTYALPVDDLTADAFDQSSTYDLIGSLTTALNQHAQSIFDSSSGIGAHLSLDPVWPWPGYASSSLAGLVAAVNDMRANFNAHLSESVVHVDVDDVNTLPTADDAVYGLVSGGLDVYADGTASCKESVHRALNRLKAALIAHAALDSKPGVIRKGHRFEVVADPTAVPPVKAASYVAVLDTPVQLSYRSVDVPVQATEVGPHANLPFPVAVDGVPPYTVRSLDAFYDAKFSPTLIAAAGGSLGQQDDTLSRAAAAMWTGRHGPTVGGLLAGTLSGHGASRSVVRESASLACTFVHPVDESWCQSERWLLTLWQDLVDPDGFSGFGPLTRLGGVVNKRVRIEATVMLRDARDMISTERITERIVAGVRSYFDDRPDWYIWRWLSLRATVTRSDRRVLKCTELRVLDENSRPLSEPAAITSSSGVALLTHFYLLDNPVTITYVAQGFEP